ncbi:hypothetical protein GF312_00870 [Candidatus Poribacteria bacterium]|nr:hypothetical protein [Candidatus Poribacteria bacterium]
MKSIFISFLVIFVIVTPCFGALDLTDPELLLYLPFNDDTEDYSIHGNHGTLAGNAEFVEGKFGQAMEFEESGEVKCPYIPLNNKSFTICMWVRPELSGAAEQCVFSQMQANATNTSMHYRIYTNGTVRMGFYSNDLDAPGVAQAGEWMHIAFWLDVEGKSRKVFINGEEAVTDAGKSGIEYLGTSGDTIIGSWGTSGQRFRGVIDEVQIWDRPLTEDEILQSMEDITALAVEPVDKLTSSWGELKEK